MKSTIDTQLEVTITSQLIYIDLESIQGTYRASLKVPPLVLNIDTSVRAFVEIMLGL